MKLDGQNRPIIASAPPGQEVCDFCASPDVRWNIECKSFQTSLGLGSLGDWAACDICVELIRQNKWKELLRRSIETFRCSHPEVPYWVAEKTLPELHSLFRLKHGAITPENKEHKVN